MTAMAALGERSGFPGSVVTLTGNGDITDWNASAERTYGWLRKDMLGQSLQQRLRCQSFRFPGLREPDAHRTLRTWSGVCERLTRSGHLHIAHIVRIAVGHRLGDTSIVEFGTDLTGAIQKGQERAYHSGCPAPASWWSVDFDAVMARAKTLVEAGVHNLAGFLIERPAMVRAMLAEARVLRVTDSALDMFSSSSRHAPLDNLGLIIPDDSLADFAEAIAEAVDGETFQVVTTRFCALDGRAFDGVMNVTFAGPASSGDVTNVGITDTGTMGGTVASVEATARRYRELFDAIPCAVAEVDSRSLFETARELIASGIDDVEAYLDAYPAVHRRARSGLKFVSGNTEFLRMVGARSEADIVGPIARFLPQTSHCARFIAACATGQSRVQADMTLLRRDGSTMPCHLETSLRPIEGRPHTSIVTLYDLSERVAAEERVADAQAESAHAARVAMLGGLGVSIAHEVAQPLAVIALDAMALRKWLASPEPDMVELDALATRLLTQTSRAMDLLGSIRAMARRAPPEVEAVDLNDVLQASLRLVANDISRNNITLDQTLAREPLWVTGDRVQLGQIVVNLVSNAIQALAGTEGSERRIGVSTREEDAHAELVVDDNGPGLGETAATQVFERFFTTKQGGLGIGLPIARSIAHTHGGTLVVADAPEGWRCRFLLRLQCLPGG